MKASEGTGRRQGKELPEARQNNFNIIHIVGALFVIYGHMIFIVGAQPKSVLGTAPAAMGLKLIFLVSGYLITQSFIKDSSVIRYAIRRTFRIMPGLIVLILLTTFVVGPLFTTLSTGEYFSHSHTYTYLSNMALKISYTLPGVFTDLPYPNAVNGSLWSLPPEVACYILLPVVLLLFKKLFKNYKAGIIVLAGTSVVLSVVRMLFFSGSSFVLYGSDWLQAVDVAPYFFIGALYTLPSLKKLLNLQLASGLLFIAIFMNFSAVYTELINYVVLSYFVFSLALAPTPKFARVLTKNDYGYGMYLYGFVVQQMVVSVTRPLNLPFNVTFLISVVITFICAKCSWHFVEKPMQRLGKKLLEVKWIKSRKGKGMLEQSAV
ncbi:acyltransferase [Clostridia bacterium OttesenSCG-928-F22]|nr:acyltransferase [Clostridia bacterium OttesenSCG-928-F22]